MRVNVQQTGDDQLPFGVQRVGSVARDVLLDRGNAPAGNGHIASRVQPHRRIDDAPAANNQVIARRGERPRAAREQRRARRRGREKLAPVQHRHLRIVRTHPESFLCISPRRTLDVERVLLTVKTVFPNGSRRIAWREVLDLIEAGDHVVIRVGGGFDDREASIDSFLAADLLRELGTP